MIKLTPFVLGPLENNSFLLVDETSGDCMIVDPSFDPEPILIAIQERHLSVKAILLTHAHFDHIAGIPYLNAFLPQPLTIGLSSGDAATYSNSGGAKQYGFHIGELPKVNLTLFDKQLLTLGTVTIEVREVPGHTPGHVLFNIRSLQTALVGDLIFYRSVGRTDLPGGDFNTLVHSIRTQVFSLPPETILYPGHGPSTTVADEMVENPFLS